MLIRENLGTHRGQEAMVGARSFPSCRLWLSLQFREAAQGRHVGIRARFSGKRAEVGRDSAPEYPVNCALQLQRYG
jgi:hypothetical protein